MVSFPTVLSWRQRPALGRNLLERRVPRRHVTVRAESVATRGYDPNFLGLPFPLPLPMPSTDLLPHIYSENGDVKLIDHIHWSAIIDKRELRRCAAVVGLNIDGERLLSVPRKDKWVAEKETVLPREYQLGDEYYAKTHWDKGHLAMRANATWGDNEAEAREASDDTFVYTNRCLQHKEFNEDEWRKLEDAVGSLSKKEGKISVFQGPIFSETAREHIYVVPPKAPHARVPSGFFKVVCAKTNDRELAVRAFIMWQREYVGMSKSNPVKFEELQTYQVAVRQIEEETGLVFGDEIRDANPLRFSETIPVHSAEDVVGPGDEKPQEGNGSQGLRILAALVNPEGTMERGLEWVSVVNLSTQNHSLNGLAIKVDDRQAVPLPSRSLPPGESIRVQDELLVLPQGGGDIRLCHGDSQVDSVSYERNDVRKAGEGSVISFAPQTL